MASISTPTFNESPSVSGSCLSTVEVSVEPMIGVRVEEGPAYVVE